MILLYFVYLQKLQEVILETQRNAKIQMVEDTPYGNWTEIINSLFEIYITNWYTSLCSYWTAEIEMRLDSVY